MFDPKLARTIIRSKVSEFNAEFEREVPKDVVVWASYEVNRQREDATKVPDMVAAWQYAYYRSQVLPEKPFNLTDILVLGYLVKPDVNQQGIRRYNVTVGWDQKLDWPQVPRALTNLVEHGLDSLNPTDWYREFEEVHPFGDGNGRVGSILFNWLQDSLGSPKFPPDVYDPDFFNRKDDTFGSA